MHQRDAARRTGLLGFVEKLAGLATQASYCNVRTCNVPDSAPHRTLPLMLGRRGRGLRHTAAGAGGTDVVGRCCAHLCESALFQVQIRLRSSKGELNRHVASVISWVSQFTLAGPSAVTEPRPAPGRQGARQARRDQAAEGQVWQWRWCRQEAAQQGW